MCINCHLEKEFYYCDDYNRVCYLFLNIELIFLIYIYISSVFFIYDFKEDKLNSDYYDYAIILIQIPFIGRVDSGLNKICISMRSLQLRI